MKKRIVAFIVIAIMLVTISAAYAARYCDFCGAPGYYETNEYITQSYKVPCSHHTYGTDTVSQTYLVIKGYCSVGGLVVERWFLSSTSNTCNGWTEVNCLP